MLRRRNQPGQAFNGTNPDFLLKNPDFLLKNPDFLLKNPDFLLKKNVDFMIKGNGPSRIGGNIAQERDLSSAGMYYTVYTSDCGRFPPR